MNVVVIGARGMLGSDCVHWLSAAGHCVISLNSDQIDITNRHSIDHALSHLKSVDFLINCAAFTAVDLCETQQETAYLVNGIGAKNVALWCAQHHVKMVHFSTDYVFSGTGDLAHRESDPTHPINVYAKSKLQGEIGVLHAQPDAYIFRVQWLFGHHGTHFIKTICQLADTRSELKVVNDQWGSPTWTYDLAHMMTWLIEHRPAFGIYHWHNQGYCSWYDLAHYVLRHTHPTVRVIACASSEFPRPAPRPSNGRLAMDKFMAIPHAPEPRSWMDAVSAFLNDHPQ